MNAIYPKPKPADGLDVAMRALYELARFSNSGERIGMTGPDVAAHVERVVRRALAQVEAMEQAS